MKKSVIIILLSTVVLLLIGFGVYSYNKDKKADEAKAYALYLDYWDLANKKKTKIKQECYDNYYSDGRSTPMNEINNDSIQNVVDSIFKKENADLIVNMERIKKQIPGKVENLTY